MSQQTSSSVNTGQFIEFNKLLPDLHEFLQEILYNENLSENAAAKCTQFIEKLDGIVKPPVLPPRSRTSVAGNSTQSLLDEASSVGVVSKDEISPEFLEQQRELSRQGTLIKEENRPKLTLQASNEQEITNEDTIDEDPADIIYERIQSIPQQIDEPPPVLDHQHNSLPQISSPPPPVPLRKGRAPNEKASSSPAAKRKRNCDQILVLDLRNPLYSGLLRNVRSDIKQWCVIKQQILYLFNDLDEPASFMVDLHEYEVFKDPDNVFRISRSGEPSIILAAVDETQYQLWLNAFSNAKFIIDKEDGKTEGAGEISEYVSSAILCNTDGSEDEDTNEDTTDDDYEKPNQILNTTLVPPPVSTTNEPSNLVYEPMSGVYPTSPPPPSSPPMYEAFEPAPVLPVKKRFTFIENNADYSSMPLPPLPDGPFQPSAKSPRVTSEYEEDDGSLSGSFESLSGSEIATVANKSLKGKHEKEIQFFHDLTAVFCGILHKRKMLAVWQKRYCKVKDESLILYRNPDDTEACLTIRLKGYRLDRAEETWRSYAFKMFRDNSEVMYFAADTRHNLIKWLSVLAKEINKEKFVPTDSLAEAGGKLRADSNGTSNESLSHGTNNKLNYSMPTSDFDADNESMGEESRVALNKHKLLKASKKRPKKSFDDPSAVIQGYLLRKLSNHWSRRWCSVKGDKLLSFKNSPYETPDLMILLAYASLTTPTNAQVEQRSHVFELRYEGERTVMFSAKHKDDWLAWTNTIRKFVASESEEKFPYINVPPDSNRLSLNLIPPEPPDEDYLIADDDGIRKSASVSVPIPPRRPTCRTIPADMPARSKTEIKDAVHCGIVNELQVFQQSFRHLEHFMVLTKEKWLKFYPDITSTTPTACFYAMNVLVIEEQGMDSVILRLQVEQDENEITLKTTNAKECKAWKDAFEKIHYESIGGDVTDSAATVDTSTTEKMFRKRAKTQDENSEPVLISHSKTMPNMGKLKKLAKERRKEKISRQRTIEKSNNIAPPEAEVAEKRRTLSEIPKRGAIASLIRTLTIDALSRKGKNQSYVLNEEEDTVLKETQRGYLKQVVVEGDVTTIQERFCRISGKVFSCMSDEADRKPLFRIPLKSASIEEFVDTALSTYRLQISAMDTGMEYLFELSSEVELEEWIAALEGEDILHSSLSLPRSRTSSSGTLHAVNPGEKIRPPTTITTASPTKSLSSIDIDRSFGSSNRNSAISTSSTISTEGELVKLQAADTEHIRLQDYFYDVQDATRTSCWCILRETVLEVYAEESDRQPVKVIRLSNAELTLDATECCLTLKTDSFHRFLPQKPDEFERWGSLLQETVNSLQQGLFKRFSNIVSPVKRREKKKQPVNNRQSMFLVPGDMKALQKFEESVDPTQFRSGILLEVFPNTKQKPKEWFAWIKQGYFYISKRTNKPVRTIDLSLVIITDESDPSSDRYRFRIDYTSEEKKERSSVFQTNTQEEAEHWMVALSMGILFHRLSGVSVRNSTYKEDASTSKTEDFEFFRFDSVPVRSKDDIAGDDVSFLNIDESILSTVIKRELKKCESVNKDLKGVSDMLSTEFPSPPKTPDDKDSEQSDLTLIKSDINSKCDMLPADENPDSITNDPNETDSTTENEVVECVGKGTTNIDAIKNDTPLDLNDSSVDKNLTQKEDKIDETIKTNLKTDKEKVRKKSTTEVMVEETSKVDVKSKVQNFETGTLNTQEELLDNIPDKENAEEAFKNVTGILRQQESIRRSILKRQSTRRKPKKVPPQVKPKPMTSFVSDVTALSLTELRTYKQDLEDEQRRLVKRIKNVCPSKDMQMSSGDKSAAKENNCSENQSENDKHVSKSVSFTKPRDIEALQLRLQKVDKELKNVHIKITRKVSAQNQKKAFPVSAVQHRSSLNDISKIVSSQSLKFSRYFSEPSLANEPIII